MAEVFLKRYDVEYVSDTVKYSTIKLELLVDSDGLTAVEEFVSSYSVGTILQKNLYKYVKEFSHDKQLL